MLLDYVTHVWAHWWLETVRLGSWECPSSWCASSSRERKMGRWTLGGAPPRGPLAPEVISGAASHHSSRRSSQWVSVLKEGRVCFQSRITWCILQRHVGEGNGNPLLSSWLENCMDRGAWELQSMGLQRVGHDWAIKPPPQLSIPDFFWKRIMHGSNELSFSYLKHIFAKVLIWW